MDNQKSSQKAARKAASPAPRATTGGEDHKISMATSYLMIGSALFADSIIFLVGIIPLAGQVIAPIIGWIVMGFFMVWFLMRNVRLMTPRRLKLLGIGSLISLIPIIPPVTFYVWRMIISTKSRASGLAGGLAGKITK